MDSRNLVVPILSALVAGAAVASTVLVVEHDQRGPRGPQGEQGPVGTSAYRGTYVLTDGSTCPPGTTLANAEVTVGTNSSSGRSTFGLCYIK